MRVDGDFVSVRRVILVVNGERGEYFERLAIGLTRELAVYLFSVLINHPLAVGCVSVLRVLPEVSYSVRVVRSLVVVDCGDLGSGCEVSARLV